MKYILNRSELLRTKRPPQPTVLGMLCVAVPLFALIWFAFTP